MNNIDEELLSIREEFRKMLLSYRNNKALRANILVSLWMTNRLIDAQKVTKAAIKHSKTKQR